MLGGVNMELLQLKYFKTVAELGKISAAAEALYISAPALSTSISRLEKELGVQLFDRYAKRIALNAQGEIFLRYVNQMFDALECGKKELLQNASRHTAGNHYQENRQGSYRFDYSNFLYFRNKL